MALKITAECTCCDACLLECPNEAISAGEKIYVIDPDLCTECVGFSATTRCADVCPVECCVPDEHVMESKESLLEKAR
ncbi:MAG: YfhL family 4Fe-4S dicluster ferredoxin, partial [Chromatiales bacterium]